MSDANAPCLLVLAAGMGSRYGGLKQMDAMGPDGQTMLDYAVLDAQRAGFGKVVFVIREDFAQAFEEEIGRRAASLLPVEYAWQALDDLPAPYEKPPDRHKPWGTAHAVRAARNALREPFMVINADDFYGREAYQTMADHLRQLVTPEALHVAMVGYPLERTLSPHGTVNRGICQLESGHLQGVEEYVRIGQDADGVLRGDDMAGRRRELAPSTLVSMNCWGFTPAIFPQLETYFGQFLANTEADGTAECYLPAFVDHLLASGQARCPVLLADSPWFGVTYPEDKPRVVASLQALTATGLY